MRERNFDLSGRCALVTGAGRGLGAAIARRLAHSGAAVIAVARNAGELESLRDNTPGIETWQEDVTTTAFAERIEGLAQLDVLVNNAGFNRPQPMAEVDVATLDHMLSLNVRALYLASQAAVRVMRRGGGGSIVQMSSQMGHVGSPSRTVYCMTKHAVEGLTKAMAVELGPDHIRVNAVAPTFIETPLTKPMLDDPTFRAFVDERIPLGQLGQPEDVATAVLYLASDASQMITGHSLRVDGGWTAH
ncbi:MAG: SDR family oxidoreductase [Pseudomonadota bacterium]